MRCFINKESCNTAFICKLKVMTEMVVSERYKKGLGTHRFEYDKRLFDLIFENMAGTQGFEPRLTSSEPAVLPLNDVPGQILYASITCLNKYKIKFMSSYNLLFLFPGRFAMLMIDKSFPLNPNPCLLSLDLISQTRRTPLFNFQTFGGIFETRLRKHNRFRKRKN